jgi:uncharacterized membrane protein YdbT with pleckstrin-like domain
MTDKKSETQSRALWTGKPWIFPNLLVRSIAAVAVAVAVFWLEYSFGVASWTVLNMQIVLWTGLAIFLVWVPGTLKLLLIRACNQYILRNDGLEIRVGLFASKSSVIAAAGFSDLEVTRSVSARIINSGDITIRTQGEKDIKMERVKNPLKVADQIREVMARPLFRVQGQEAIEEHAQRS